MNPITRLEYYLAKIAGTWDGRTPEPITIEEYYLAIMTGDYSGNAPWPVTRLQYYMEKAAGVWSGNTPEPVTRVEQYWAAIANGGGNVPEPVTREEHLLSIIVGAHGSTVAYVSGNPIILTDAKDNAELKGLRIFGKSIQNGDPSPESPVPIVNAGGKGNIGIKIEGKNLIPESEIRLDPFLKRAFLKGYLLKAGVTYTLSTKGIVSGIYFNNVGETERIAYAYEAKSVTYTPNVDILTTLRVWDDGSHMSDLKDYYIQLEVGDTATGYEPYKTPQNLTVQTPNGLLGIPVKSGGNYTDHDGRRWICDEIDYGQSVYIRRIGKTVVDGENIKFTASADENYWNLPSKSSPGIISGGIISAFFKTGIFPANITNQFIFVKKESISSHFATVDELNAFCVQKNTEGTPVEFYYMANPIETPLSPEDIAAYKQLHTYAPTTTIINDGGAGMEVGYRKI